MRAEQLNTMYHFRVFIEASTGDFVRTIHVEWGLAWLLDTFYYLFHCSSREVKV